MFKYDWKEFENKDASVRKIIVSMSPCILLAFSRLFKRFSNHENFELREIRTKKKSTTSFVSRVLRITRKSITSFLNHENFDLRENRIYEFLFTRKLDTRKSDTSFWVVSNFLVVEKWGLEETLPLSSRNQHVICHL